MITETFKIFEPNYKTKIAALIRHENNMEERKVFCIGFNKTGTTSLEAFMRENGFKCGNQQEGELLINSYLKGDWEKLIAFCQSADFFQDLPFSAPKTAAILAEAYPNAQYILTVRENAEIWYNSITEFHKIKFGKNGKLPSKHDLQEAEYRYKGFAWDANRALYDSPENEPYNKESLIKAYETHIENVKRIFSGKQNLIIIDLSKPNTVAELNTFLGIESTLETMPWLNKTSEAKK